MKLLLRRRIRRPEGSLGVRQLAAAFKNSPIFKDFAKSASKLAHSESFAYKNYAALPACAASLRTFINSAG
jgi:hypothetical protein